LGGNFEKQKQLEVGDGGDAEIRQSASLSTFYFLELLRILVNFWSNTSLVTRL